MPSLWSDLPRRLTTVCIGAPLVVAILSHRITCRIFFQCVHLLCCLEWIRLVPQDEAKETTGQSQSQQHDTGKGGSVTAATVDETARYKKTDGDGSREKAGVAKNMCTSTGDARRPDKDVPLPLKLFPMASILIINASNQQLPLTLCLWSTMIHLSIYWTTSDNFGLSTTAARQHAQHGLLYISLSFHCLLQIASTSFSHTVWFLFVVWNGDTGALISGRVGRMLCKTDLLAAICPRMLIDFVKRVSPSKSMTGLVGGVLGAALTAVYWPSVMLCVQSICLQLGIVGYPVVFGWLEGMVGTSSPDVHSYFDLDQMNAPGGAGILDFDDLPLPSFVETIIPIEIVKSGPFRRALVGIVLGIFAILGDLVESSVKRASRQKDSGKLLPGHGGILDRFDSTLLSAVVYYHWCLCNAA